MRVCPLVGGRKVARSPVLYGCAVSMIGGPARRHTCPLCVWLNIIHVRLALGSRAISSSTSCTRGSLMPSTTSTALLSFGTILAPA